MSTPEPAAAPPRALVAVGRPAVDPVAEAQARLDAVVAEVTALDAEVEQRSAALAAFALELTRRLALPDAEARRAASLVRRLQALADLLAEALRQVQESTAAGRAPARKRPPRAGRRPRPGAGSRPFAGWADPDEDDADGPGADGDGAATAEPGGPADAAPEELPTVAQQAAELKRLYRRLARLLHPDLASDDGERVRLSGLMARANAAYQAADLTTLTLMAERLGAGEPPGEFGEAERLLHLGRRIEQLQRVAASLRRERDRLGRTETARLLGEAERRAAAGGDYFTESEAELVEEAGAARADALVRLAALGRSARELSSARRKAMDELERRGKGGVRRAFDPLAEGGLVRRSAARLDRAKAGAPARELARWLEEAATRAPWEAGLTLVAALAELAGERPPPSMATAEGLAARWERLRQGWPGAPELARALAQLPRHLAPGARAGPEEVVAGVQLTEAPLLAGVRIALEREPVAALARQVLAALGPAERCGPCRQEVLGLHLLRTRGLDERHGVVCPRCGQVLRSYWRYGEPEGLEGLWPLALELRVAAELAVRLGDCTLGFGLRPAEAEALTAKGLVELLDELYLTPCQVQLPPGAVRVVAGRVLLEPRAQVTGRGRLGFRVEADTTAEALVELLRTRIEQRFRPGA
jgi:hypothetical protein